MTFDQRFDRKSAIGASEIATVMDISPWSRPSDLWISKRCGQTIDRSTFFTRRGNQLEPTVKAEYEKQTHSIVLPQDTTIRHPTIPILSCTPDGWIKTGVHGVEFKCVFGESQADWRSGLIPDHYMLQCQISMEITGASKWDIAAYLVEKGHAEDDDPPGELIHARLYRDEALIDSIVGWTILWWAQHVEDGVPVVDTKLPLKERLAAFWSRVDAMRVGGQAADLRQRAVQAYIGW